MEIAGLVSPPSSTSGSTFLQQQTMLVEQKQKLKHYEALIIFERNHSASLNYVPDAELTQILASISDLISSCLAKLHATDPYIDVAWLLSNGNNGTTAAAAAAGGSNLASRRKSSLVSQKNSKTPAPTTVANAAAAAAAAARSSSTSGKQRQQQQQQQPPPQQQQQQRPTQHRQIKKSPLLTVTSVKCLDFYQNGLRLNPLESRREKPSPAAAASASAADKLSTSPITDTIPPATAAPAANGVPAAAPAAGTVPLPPPSATATGQAVSASAAGAGSAGMGAGVGVNPGSAPLPPQPPASSRTYTRAQSVVAEKHVIKLNYFLQLELNAGTVATPPSLEIVRLNERELHHSIRFRRHTLAEGGSAADAANESSPLAIQVVQCFSHNLCVENKKYTH